LSLEEHLGQENGDDDMEKEIEIVVQSIKKIVIFECMEFPPDELFNRIKLIAMSGQPIALNWAEGVVFLFMPYQPDSDTIIEEALKGTIYWEGVLFSPMPKYQPIKKIGAREIPIIDQSPIPYLRQVAKWLSKKIT
jgi:hypothetical protein